MGIQYRDYMHDNEGAGFFRGARFSGRDMVKTLIIVNAIVFVLQTVFTYSYSEEEITRLVNETFQDPKVVEATRDLSPAELKHWKDETRQSLRLHRGSYFERWFALDPEAVFWGQVWRLTTYDFLHDSHSIWHIVFNMWLLWIVGRKVESRDGPDEFLAFYLIAGIVSGICFLLWGLLLGDLAPAIGASGAVAAVVVVYAMRWPMDEFRFFGIFPVPAYILALLAALMDLHPMLRQIGGHHYADGVAHSAHIGGMLFGVFYVRRRWHLTSWLAQIFSRNWLKRRPRVRIVRPEPEDFRPAGKVTRPVIRREEISARVDELLAKIAEHGTASLTQEEQDFLAQASRLYRDRSSS
jgi:membrane associated rhomboid family serine protease